MKKYFLTGLITLLPAAITLFIILYLVELFSAPFQSLTHHFLTYLSQKFHFSLFTHPDLDLFISRVISLIFTLLLILLLGMLTSKFFFNTFLSLFHKTMRRIPFVRTIYNLSYDIVKAAFGNDAKVFKQTSLVPFPQEGTYAVGFVTSETPPAIRDLKPDLDTVMFVPTAPHPISGFLLLTSSKKTTPLDIPTEDAFKFLISCGIVDPSKKDDVSNNGDTTPSTTA